MLLENQTRLYQICTIVFALILIVGCRQASPPQVSSISVQPHSEIQTGGTATLSVEASGSSITFSWKATSGTITGDGSSVIYKASDIPGPDAVTVEVTSDGGTVTKNLTIQVVAESPTPTLPPNNTLQRIDFNYPDSDGARKHGWNCPTQGPKPNAKTYDTLRKDSEYTQTLSVTTTVLTSSSAYTLEPLIFCAINPKASRGKLVEIVMNTHNYQGTFYVVVKVDLVSNPIPINLIDPDSPGGKNICSPIYKIDSKSYRDGCTFKTKPSALGNNWQKYNINIEEMLQTLLGKDANYVGLDSFKILPNLDLAYIAITDSQSP